MVCRWLFAQHSLPFLVGVFFEAMLLAVISTRLVLKLLRRHQIIDIPNDRSQHKSPTPRGGGWGILAIVLPLWWLIGACAPPIRGIDVPAIAFFTILLALVAWWDDVKDMSATLRLVVQAGIALIIVLMVPHEAILVTAWWPRWLEHILLFLGVIWLINLHNFMDGADGLLATHVITVLLGLAALLWFAGARVDLLMRVLILAGATAGFLFWNRPRAKVFAGDVGSMSLGLLMAVLIIESTQYVHAATIMILPLYFVMDATVTLVRRIHHGHHPFTPHREHFFQKILQAGYSTWQLLLAILVLNIVLFAIAFGWHTQPWWSLVLLAIPLVSAVLWYWHRCYQFKDVAVNKPVKSASRARQKPSAPARAANKPGEK